MDKIFNISPSPHPRSRTSDSLSIQFFITSIVIIIYIIGLIFGAIVLKIWSADTSILKGLLGLGWTALLLIGIFFAEKNEKN